MALLEIRSVCKSFRTLRALESVDLDVEAGTFHGLIGPNGSGKSTLLKAIAGAHFADSGSIVFDGTRHRARDALRARPCRPQPQVPDHRGAARSSRSTTTCCWPLQSREKLSSLLFSRPAPRLRRAR